MINKFLFVFAIVLCMSGCATPTKMAFQNDSERVAEKQNPVFLMTVTLRNAYKPSFQPRLQMVHIEKSNAKEKADKFNFTIDDKAENKTDSVDSGNNYLLRFELAPGSYEIRGLTSQARKLTIHGFFFTPLHSPLEAKGPGVFYLGHVNATIRERQGDEFRAGPVIPLIDQAVAGASGGTFDVEITDEWSTDEATFISKFPVLAGVAIQKSILPAFDRTKVQQ